jgi:hypothetical protein
MAFCTACHSEIAMEKRPSAKKSTCPVCKKQVIVEGILKKYSHVRRETAQDHYFVRRFENGLLCLGVHVFYEEKYDHTNKIMMISRASHCYRAIVNDGIRTRSYNLRKEQPVRTSLSYPTFSMIPNYYMSWKSEYELHFWTDEAWKLTQKHPNPHFHSTPSLESMNSIMRYDQVAELLNKNGFTFLMKNYLEGNAPCLRTTAKTKEKLFGLSRFEIRIAKKYNYSAIEIEAMQQNRKKAGYVPKEEFILLESMTKCAYPLSRIRRLFPELTTADLAGALTRYGADDFSALYADYLEAVIRIPGTRLRSVLYPKDFKEAHDRSIARVNEIKNSMLDAKIKERADELKFLSFCESGLLVCIPTSCEEIIHEGRLLSTCVGRYVDRVAKKETAIVFIRKTEEPKTPFVTVEVDTTKNQIVQARGYNNGVPDQETKDFLDRWINRTLRRKRARKNLHAVAISA